MHDPEVAKAMLAWAKRRLAQAQGNVQALPATIEKLEQQVREEGLWDLHLYTHLNHLGHTQRDGITWGELQVCIKDPQYLITAVNPSGAWKLFFYKGTKKRPHDVCVGIATRQGWKEGGL